MHIALAIFLLQTVGAGRPDRIGMNEPPLQETVVARFAVTVPVDPPTMVAAAAHSRAPLGSLGRILTLGLFGKTVTLKWKASPDSGVKNWSGYIAYRATGATGKFTALSSKPTTALTIRDSTVRHGQLYRYYVVALVGKVMSKPSNVASVTP